MDVPCYAYGTTGETKQESKTPSSDAGPYIEKPAQLPASLPQRGKKEKGKKSGTGETKFTKSKDSMGSSQASSDRKIRRNIESNIIRRQKPEAPVQEEEKRVEPFNDKEKTKEKPLLNDLEPVPIEKERHEAIKGTKKEHELDFANVSIPDILQQSVREGHETKFLKDFNYEGDAERSHNTYSFLSEDRLITDTALEDTRSREKPLHMDQMDIDISKSIVVEQGINSDMSSILIQSKLESPRMETHEDMTEIFKYIKEEEKLEESEL